MGYVTDTEAGSGLIKYGRALVPFVNRFPRNTKLYELMTTKPGEGVFSKGAGVMPAPERRRRNNEQGTNTPDWNKGTSA